MDPLSDVLSLLKPTTYMSGGMDAGGDWSIQFGPVSGSTKCFALISGECWLEMEDVTDPVLLRAGDCVLLPHGQPFRLASDLALIPTDLNDVISAPLHGHMFCLNGGGGCVGLSASFTFAGEHAGVLLGLLPPMIHIREEANRAAMRWYMERMMKVLREPEPGGFLLGQYLAQMMLVEVLRLYVAQSLEDDVGWLFALSDKQVSAALAAMHQNPGHRWSLETLAQRAGMSRSTFALRFKEKVGTSAMDYLSRWRMLRAADRLAHSSDSVLTIAQAFGYQSESAFGLTFKKILGCSPRRYCRR